MKENSRHALSAAALRRSRLRLGLSRAAVADQVQMDVTTYASAENAHRRFPIQRLSLLPREMAYAVAEALITEFREELMTCCRGG